MTDKTQPRDWSGAVRELSDIARDYCHDHRFDTFERELFEAEALAILQEFDAQNQAVCAETPTTEEPLELVVGNLYEDADGAVVEFLGVNKYRTDIYQNAFIYVKSGNIVQHNNSAIMRKHTPKPAEHTFICEKIEQVLNTQQLQEPNAVNLYVRGKIIKQLLKELDAEPKNKHIHNYKHRNRGEGDTYFCDCGDSY